MVAEFKKGKLYRVVKHLNPGCIECVLKYVGASNYGKYGTPVKLGEYCQPANWGNCGVFKNMIDCPKDYKLIRHTDMVKFCKKLRKELRND